jgi:glyoxylase-like metal-dependent hydrolase (beta-lactamase superfamily II)
MYMDGGTFFGVVPRIEWEKQFRPDRQNRVRLGVNVLLIRHPEGNVLINTGIGSKNNVEIAERYGHRTSKLNSALKREGLTAKDIDYVFFTHLHFDHAGGATKDNNLGKLVLTFPKATHIVQRSAWEDSQNMNEKSSIAYGPGIEDLEILEKSGKLRIVDDEKITILPGIEAIVVDGHSKGHSIVLVDTGSEKYMYLSDLVPTAMHVNRACITALDHNPVQTLENKKVWLSRAVKEGWLVVFAHGRDTDVAGYINRGGFSPVNIWGFDKR